MLVYNLVWYTHVAAAVAADSTQYSFMFLYCQLSSTAADSTVHEAVLTVSSLLLVLRKRQTAQEAVLTPV